MGIVRHIFCSLLALALLLGVQATAQAQLDTIRVSVVLPLYADWHPDSLSVKQLRLRDVALEALAGVELALDSLNAPPAHFEITIVEAGEDTSGARTFTQDTFADAHWIIGPLRRSPFAEVHHMAPDVAHLALTDLGKSTLHLGRRVFMPYTPADVQMQVLAEFVRYQHPGENKLMLASDSPRTRRTEEAFRQRFNPPVSVDAGPDSAAAPDSTLSANAAHGDSLESPLVAMDILREVPCTSKSLGGIWDSTVLYRRNIIVAPGGKACRSLAGQLQTESHVRDSIPIVLYAHQDWTGFNFLNWDWREEVAMTTPAQGFHAENDSLFDQFQSRYAERTGSAPSNFSILAYDATLDLASRLVQLGNGWMTADQASPVYPVKTVHHRFNWHTPDRAQGWINYAVRLVRQDNYRLIELNLAAPDVK
jgi:hypothetical protein